MGMSLFKDSANGVEGTSKEVTWVVGGSSVSGSISFIDAVGVSSTIFGKSSTSVGFKVLPDLATIPVAEDASGIALN
jgi:hypothetical protein